MNTKRVAHHWDDLLRIAGSLKLGTIQASELIRSLLKSERPSSLALATMEAGRINKTVHLRLPDELVLLDLIADRMVKGQSTFPRRRAVSTGVERDPAEAGDGVVVLGA